MESFGYQVHVHSPPTIPDWTIAYRGYQRQLMSSTKHFNENNVCYVHVFCRHFVLSSFVVIIVGNIRITCITALTPAPIRVVTPFDDKRVTPKSVIISDKQEEYK